MHDLCTLLGYGADAICPYVVFETMTKLRNQRLLEAELNDAEIFANYVAATARGISKVMAKMGISTLHSYKVRLMTSELLTHFLLVEIYFLTCWVVRDLQVCSRKTGQFVKVWALWRGGLFTSVGKLYAC